MYYIGGRATNNALPFIIEKVIIDTVWYSLKTKKISFVKSQTQSMSRSPKSGALARAHHENCERRSHQRSKRRKYADFRAHFCSQITNLSDYFPFSLHFENICEIPASMKLTIE